MPFLTVILLCSLAPMFTCSPVASTDILFPDQLEEKIYKLWLDNCTQYDEMPYFNKTLNKYECYPILTLGPCGTEEWFVLNQTQPNHAICVKQPCPCGPDQEYSYYDYYEDSKSGDEENCKMTDTNGLVFYNAINFGEKCLEVKDPEPCPRDHQELLPDPFGIG